VKKNPKRQRSEGSLYQPKHSRFLWVKYYRNGKAYWESTHQSDERKAQKFLQNRLGEIASGNFLGPAVEKVRVSELSDDMFRDYRVNGHKSLQLTEWRWKKHLAWGKLTVAAELPGLLFHDLRRSAVRNMVRRGVPEVVAMRISGHKTRSIFDRYNIANETGLADAATRIEQGSIREPGHTSGTVDQASQTEAVQTEPEHQYNQ
jgi:integrase